MENKYILALNKVEDALSHFNWRLDKSFFELFDNEEIIDADINLEIEIEKSKDYLGLHGEIDGYVTTSCDRCLEDLKIDVSQSLFFRIKFGKEVAENQVLTCEEGETELIYLSQDNTDFDFGQVIYDYICTSLPLQKFHEDGECNKDCLKYLGQVGENKTSGNNHFAGLKDLLNKE